MIFSAIVRRFELEKRQGWNSEQICWTLFNKKLHKLDFTLGSWPLLIQLRRGYVWSTAERDERVFSSVLSFAMRYLEVLVLLHGLKCFFSSAIECDKPNQIYYDPEVPGGECLVGCKAGKIFWKTKLQLISNESFYLGCYCRRGFYMDPVTNECLEGKSLQS